MGNELLIKSKETKKTKAAKSVGNASKPVSLAPLSFDEVLDGLLAVKSEPKSEASKAASKKPAKRSAKKKRK